MDRIESFPTPRAPGLECYLDGKRQVLALCVVNTATYRHKAAILCSRQALHTNTVDELFRDFVRTEHVRSFSVGSKLSKK